MRPLDGADGDDASLDEVEPARMSRTNRNFAFAYTFLVILPLVGLAGILKTGRSLTAPVSIDGIWTLQIDSAQLNSLPCNQTLAALPDKTISISQSGTSFELSFPGGPKMIGSGTLDGTTLHASLIPLRESSSKNSCGDGRQLSLLATVDRKSDFRSLAGTLSVTNCSTCASVGFQAERQAPAAPKGGQ